MLKSIHIGGKAIGSGHPCFIIAEAGVNHNGDLKLAKKLVDVAVSAKADAVKFQTFKAEELASVNAPKAAYQKETTESDESQLQMLRKLEFTESNFQELMGYCRKAGILFLSTPFEEKSADLLFNLGVEAFKIPSGEITNLPLLIHIARKNRPMIVSTGMSNLGEIETAVREIGTTGNNNLILLHCVSNYPGDPVDVNLMAMDTMRQAFGYPVGYSDHTLGPDVALAAVALGACLIEKHFTLDKDMPGPDHKASMEPEELIDLVKAIRRVESAMGSGRKIPAPSEAGTAEVVRKSLIAKKDLSPGTILTEEMIAIRRPGNGLPPYMLPHILGLEVKREVKEGSIISMEIFR